jgi:hypothetical protein
MRKIVTVVAALLVAMAATGVVVAVAFARPSAVEISHVEPDTLSSEAGGTLSVYGSGFTTQTLARLKGYNVLATSTTA